MESATFSIPSRAAQPTASKQKNKKARAQAPPPDSRRTQSALGAGNRFPAANHSRAKIWPINWARRWVGSHRHEPAGRAHAIRHCSQVQALQSDGNLLVEFLRVRQLLGLHPAADAQKLFDLGDVVSVLEFKIDDIYQAPEIAQKLEAAAGKGFMSTNWMEQNRAIFHALRLERLVTFITIGLIVFVAALNILISLIMMVMEKTRDIAVLVSMGAKKRQIRRIFIYQGILIGVIGTVLGLIAGYLLSWAAGHYHLVSLSAEVYSIDYVPFAPRVTRWSSGGDAWPSASRSLRPCIPHGRPPAFFPPKRCGMNDGGMLCDAERYHMTKASLRDLRQAAAQTVWLSGWRSTDAAAPEQEPGGPCRRLWPGRQECP